MFYIEGISPATGKPEKIYYLMYRKNGKLIDEKAGRQIQDDMTPARASQLRALKMAGKVPTNKEQREAEKAEKEAEKGKWTVNRLWDEYRKQKPNLKGKATYKSCFDLHLKDEFGSKEPKDILPLDIQRIKNRLSKKKSPQTVQHVLELLRRLINFGTNNRLCEGIGFKIQMPKVDNIKTEDLTSDELKSLLEAIEKDTHPHAGAMMKMALFTGMRRGELFKLKWKDIDFDRGFINIIDPKGGPDQKIPLNDAARELLKNHKKTRSRYVFPGRKGGQRTNIRIQVNKIRDAAGLPKNFRAMHGLRHVYASMLASSGEVDMFVLQRLLTHKDFKMTQRYAHLRDEALKKASNLAGTIIEQASKNDSEKKVVNLEGNE